MLKKLLKHPRILVLIAALLLSIAAINPAPGQEGLAIRSVAKNSSAELAGIKSPEPTTAPRSREVVLSINNYPLKTLEDYYSYVSTLPVNQTVTLKTNKNLYVLKTLPEYNVTYTGRNVTRIVSEEVFNETLNKTVKVNKTVTEPEVIKKVAGVADLGLTLYPAPKSNIRMGLDLTGGTRVILKPEEPVSPDDMDILLANIKERLNVYGLSDIVVRSASDLSGEKFIIVEIAGATKEEVAGLIARQGKFEAKVGNQTVFKGGKDITYVCRSASCSGIDPRRGCGQSNGQWFCSFYFQIKLSPEAAQRQAEATKNLEVVNDETGSYLSEPLTLFLDDEQVDSLRIDASLKGRAVTDISITGSGSGATRKEALSNSLKQMKRLQTILITGSLPVKLKIERTDTLSPLLGEQFLRNAGMIGLVAVLAVTLVVFLRYKRLEITVPMIITMLSEAVIILGVAAMIGWNLDLAAIAGIIIAIGTGVDDQIVIVDETIGRKKVERTWKEKLKNAFFIIFASYFTLVVAMIPLWFAGAGLLRGFAITTILGVSVGVFITRPAYAAMVEFLLRRKE